MTQYRLTNRDGLPVHTGELPAFAMLPGAMIRGSTCYVYERNDNGTLIFREVFMVVVA